MFYLFPCNKRCVPPRLESQGDPCRGGQESSRAARLAREGRDIICDLYSGPRSPVSSFLAAACLGFSPRGDPYLVLWFPLEHQVTLGGLWLRRECPAGVAGQWRLGRARRAPRLRCSRVFPTWLFSGPPARGRPGATPGPRGEPGYEGFHSMRDCGASWYPGFGSRALTLTPGSCLFVVGTPYQGFHSSLRQCSGNGVAFLHF